MSAEARVETLPRKTKIIYGIGDTGNALINSAIQFYLMKFYTDGALVSPALAGNALLLGKLWDAVNDPLFGWFTDRTESRFGKRRVFMIFGAVPLAIAIGLLPALFIFMAVPFLFRYPITRQSHAQVQEQLAGITNNVGLDEVL